MGQCEETLSRGIFLDDLRGKQEEDQDNRRYGHFRAIVARLVKHPFREYHKCIRIFFEPRTQLPIVVLRLWGGAVKPLGDFSPMLL